MENKPTNNSQFRIISPDVKIGKDTKIYSFTNLYGCEIGERCSIGTFVEIQKGVNIGNDTRIQSHTFLCEGVTIGDRCFIGHGVMTINDNNPNVGNSKKPEESEDEWKVRVGLSTIQIQDDCNIGTNATLLGGIVIGKGATIGAGAVVTTNVPPGETWVGVPAHKLK